jgi:hypothetical protein
MVRPLPIAALIISRCRELGLRKIDLIRRTGLQNQAKAIRRLNNLLDGDLKSTRGLVAELPATLAVSPEEVEKAITETRAVLAAEADAHWRASFIPHAIIETERRIPSPIFVAAVIGVEKILRIDFDNSDCEESYLSQALAELEKRRERWPHGLPGFGRPTGITVNFSPDNAVQYSLDGSRIAELPKACRIGFGRLMPKVRLQPASVCSTG